MPAAPVSSGEFKLNNHRGTCFLVCTHIMRVAYKHSGTNNRFFCLHPTRLILLIPHDVIPGVTWVTSMLMANKNRSLEWTQVLVKALQESQRQEWNKELCQRMFNHGRRWWWKLEQINCALGCSRTSARLGIEHAANLREKWKTLFISYQWLTIETVPGNRNCRGENR